MWTYLLVAAILSTAKSKQIPLSTELATTTVASATESDTTAWPGALAPLDTLTVACERDSMHVTISLAHNDVQENSIYESFNGIVYPAGLGSNSSCLRQYVSARGDLQYTIPLRGCNTMSNDNDDGTVEYYNNIIVQPHLKLVTGQGRGYHVRCRYRRRDITQFHLYRPHPHADRLSDSQDPPTNDEYDEDSGLLPSVTMKIYKGDPENNEVASNVRIGDTLTLVVSLEKQRQYGILVSECAVRDGLGWAEQSLIADDGCPLDGEIMGMFQYSSDKQSARVAFPAHKFPYTASVYYTCEVKLCDLNHQTDCEPCAHKNNRVRRQSNDEGSPATVELFSGLYVNEADSPENDDVTSEKDDGTVEYYNNIIVQPHLKLVTGQGRGYHVRCRYRRRDITQFHLYRPHPHADRLSDSQDPPTNDEYDEDSGLLPSVTMKIYKGDPENNEVASNVRIGDTLTLVVSLEKQRQYGILVSECAVRDGLGWAEQSLIADDGCPLDGEIMGMFQYSSDKQSARVAFPAHKFPYTASVYYTCEVKLCDLNHQTDCEPCAHKNNRVRRQSNDEGSPATVELFSGLYVNEADSPENDDVTSEKDDGTVEYYNNIIVQPHLKLVTGQGRGYHVRCRYRRRDITQFHLYRPHPHADRLSDSQDPPTNDEYDEDSGLLPSVTMKIYKGDPENNEVASNVRIGDTLTLVVSLEKQRQYGILVSECAVRDGLGWAEQSLIADDGCPLDGEIMGMFQYSSDKQSARVAFPAHKFPYTASVYYTCEVKLCDLNHQTDCEPCAHKNNRVRRQSNDEGSPATVELFSGLYVNEADSPENDDVTSEKKEDEICISQRNFAIGICVAGVILMICVIAAIAFILARRRNPKTYSRTGSSLYSGPYTNTGYSHTS